MICSFLLNSASLTWRIVSSPRCHNQQMALNSRLKNAILILNRQGENSKKKKCKSIKRLGVIGNRYRNKSSPKPKQAKQNKAPEINIKIMPKVTNYKITKKSDVAISKDDAILKTSDDSIPKNDTIASSTV